MFTKIFGIVCFIAGILMILFFPEIKEYQPEEIGFAGILVGFGLIALGIYFLKI
ncbi:MAG: hypothetical protein QW423_02455 [Candidatus Aenigmatarchaeota archaeon]